MPDEHIAALYDELRRIAGRRMAYEPADHTLQPTALVHEAWLRMQGSELDFNDRQHFFATAVTAMRRILIERARKVGRAKRGGRMRRVEIDDAMLATPASVDVVDLAETLEILERRDPPLATLVSLRYLLGCTIAETAETLGVSPAKVKKDLAFAKAWLTRQLQSS